MAGALKNVGLTMGGDMATLFDARKSAGKLQRLQSGKKVLEEDRFCVVRNGMKSLPFSALRQPRSEAWVCLSCRTGDRTYDHVSVAVGTNKAREDGLGEECSDSDMDEHDKEEVRLLAVAATASNGHDIDSAGAVELPPRLPGSSVPLAAVNR